MQAVPTKVPAWVSALAIQSERFKLTSKATQENCPGLTDSWGSTHASSCGGATIRIYTLGSLHFRPRWDFIRWHLCCLLSLPFPPLDFSCLSKPQAAESLPLAVFAPHQGQQ